MHAVVEYIDTSEAETMILAHSSLNQKNILIIESHIWKFILLYFKYYGLIKQFFQKIIHILVMLSHVDKQNKEFLFIAQITK